MKCPHQDSNPTRETRRVCHLGPAECTVRIAFDPGTKRWYRLPSKIRDLPLIALTHFASDGCLYALGYRSGARVLRRLRRFNIAGASLGSIDLHPAVPVSDGSADAASRTSRTFVVDPATGEVFHPETAS